MLGLPTAGSAERLSFEKRFWSKVRKVDPSDCWEWQGCLKGSGRGYGSIALGSRMVRAHRVALSLALGRELLDTEHALHRCDNTRCCNPNHLYAGDHSQNMRDTAERHRRRPMRGAQNPRAKLTDDDVRTIRASNSPLRVMAEQFGVDQSLISLIRLRKAWKHVA
jgi:hypothetical protein